MTWKTGVFLPTAFVSAVVVSGEALGSWVGAIAAHPTLVQHGIPTMESPGWSGPVWETFEFSKANVWNSPMTLLNIENNRTVTHTADFEENRLRMELGVALFSRLSFAVESSYVERNGGFLDDTIDRFHIMSGSDRFSRQLFDQNQSLFEVKSNGETRVSRAQASGFDNLRSKLKWWIAGGDGKCIQCGIALQAQAKTPLSSASTGLTSGTPDFSGMLYGGFRIFSNSSIGFAGGVSSLGENLTFRDWPRYSAIQIYGLNFDFSVGSNWFLDLEFRTHSPFMKIHSLRLVTTETDPEKIKDQFVGTGWNSLVEWSTFEWISIGRRWGNGNEVSFRFLEDFGYSDAFRTNLYVTNAPDISLVLSARFSQ